MNTTQLILKLSFCKDSELLQILKLGLSRFGSFKRSSSPHSPTRRKRNTRCISMTVPKVPLPSPTLSRISLSLYPHDKSFFESAILVENVFKKLIQDYKTTSWVRSDNMGEIHIAALQQFWLDCYASDANFMGLLLESLQHKVWIGLKEFTRCIESAQKVSAFAMFSIKRFDKRLQNLFLIQKMICKG
jgi:hypothetical protein